MDKASIGHATYPTPFITAHRTCHVLTSIIFLNSWITFRTFISLLFISPFSKFLFSDVVASFPFMPWKWAIFTKVIVAISAKGLLNCKAYWHQFPTLRLGTESFLSKFHFSHNFSFFLKIQKLFLTHMLLYNLFINLNRTTIPWAFKKP